VGNERSGTRDDPKESADAQDFAEPNAISVYMVCRLLSLVGLTPSPFAMGTWKHGVGNVPHTF